MDTAHNDSDLLDFGNDAMFPVAATATKPASDFNHAAASFDKLAETMAAKAAALPEQIAKLIDVAPLLVVEEYKSGVAHLYARALRNGVKTWFRVTAKPLTQTEMREAVKRQWHNQPGVKLAVSPRMPSKAVAA